jgi:hypothetical protein
MATQAKSQNVSTLSTAKREIISTTIAQIRKFRFCGPSDDPDEQTAELERQETKFARKDAAIKRNSTSS